MDRIIVGESAQAGLPISAEIGGQHAIRAAIGCCLRYGTSRNLKNRPIRSASNSLVTLSSVAVNGVTASVHAWLLVDGGRDGINDSPAKVTLAVGS